jgi:hypothetical protein
MSGVLEANLLPKLRSVYRRAGTAGSDATAAADDAAEEPATRDAERSAEDPPARLHPVRAVLLPRVEQRMRTEEPRRPPRSGRRIGGRKC